MARHSDKNAAAIYPIHGLNITGGGETLILKTGI
nr:MAG TPA: hypothetical protein [Caudoviricetes sp.]